MTNPQTNNKDTLRMSLYLAKAEGEVFYNHVIGLLADVLGGHGSFADYLPKDKQQRDLVTQSKHQMAFSQSAGFMPAFLEKMDVDVVPEELADIVVAELLSRANWDATIATHAAGNAFIVETFAKGVSNE